MFKENVLPYKFINNSPWSIVSKALEMSILVPDRQKGSCILIAEFLKVAIPQIYNT